MKTNLLKFLGLILSIFTISFTASAYDFEVGGIYYNITDKTNNEVEVTKKSSVGYSGSITIPAVVNFSEVSYLVTSIGASAFSACSFLTSVTIPYSVTTIGDYAFYDCYRLSSITIPNSVTTIGDYAFYDCYSLSSITIPNSVTTIGDYAFYNCSGLKKVDISDLVSWCKINFGSGSSNPLYCAGHLYMNGDEIKELVIPDGVTSINNSAFYNCSGLTSVTIPNSVTTIGKSAFYKCSGLTSVTIPNSVTTIGDYAFYKCSGLTSVTIRNSVTTIGDYAFYGCSGLTSVTIPNSVATIGNDAFYNCSGLKKVDISDLVSWCKINFGNGSSNPLYCAGHLYMNGDEIKELVIPDGVTSINNSAFYNCSGLTSVTIPNSVTTIGDGAFYECTGLTSVTIPNSITTIGEDAFRYCESLNKVEISDLTSWCKINFGNVSSNPLYCAHHLYMNGAEIIDLIIPDGVTTIGNYAFAFCRGLQSVTIPNSVTTIGKYAFRDCSRLTSVTIPNSITTIGNEAFYSCSGLTNLSIGKNITNIGQSAFEDCTKLATVNIYATEAPAMTSNSFPYNGATFHVPRGCKAKYAFLYTFGNIIDDLENEEDYVDDIFVDDADFKVDIFNINGQIIKRQADKADIEALKPGLYIIKDRKVLVN